VLPAEIHTRYTGFKHRPNHFLLKAIDTLLGIVLPFFIVLFSRRGTYQLVFIYNHSGIELLPVTLAARLRRIPVCNIVVEWYEKAAIVKRPLQNLKWWDFLLRMKYLNRYFDFLLVLTRFLKNYYLESGYPEEKIILIPNLVNMDIDLSGTGNALNKFPKKAAFRLGYCGAPTRKDGIIDLLDAFALIRSKRDDVELFVIGDMPFGLSVTDTLKKYCEEKNISDSVIFTGLVPFNDVAALLNTSDILVLARPSGIFAEAGFPTKLGEYMACGKPIVLTNVGDFPHYFAARNEVLLAEPDNPTSIAEQIITLLNSEVLRAELGAKGCAWGREHLEYRLNAKRLTGFFQSR
jgi:glycosyltransferase involved in cell wall biosynthesis